MQLELKEYTYKELCDIMGWKPTTSGKGKKLQFEKLALICEFDKKGKNKGIKYNIKTLYDDGETKLNQARYTTSELLKLGVEYNIIYTLLSNTTIEDVEIINNGENETEKMLHKNQFIIPTLHRATGLCNDFYYMARVNREKISSIEEIDLEIVNDFFTLTNRKLNNVLENSLKDLYDKRLITYKEGKRLYFEKLEFDENMLIELKNENKTTAIKAKYNNPATDTQIAFINACERETMDKYNIKTVKQLYTLNYTNKNDFFNSVYETIIKKATESNNDEIKELKFLKRYVKAYDIYLVPKWIKEELQAKGKEIIYKEKELLEITNKLEQLKEFKFGDRKEFTNNQLIISISNNIKSRHKRANYDSIRSEPMYIENSEQLLLNYIALESNINSDLKRKLIDAEIIKKNYSNNELVEVILSISE